MTAQNAWNSISLIDTLRKGGIVVMPTDTLYGIVASAVDQHAVLRVYESRKRNPEKASIILIGDVNDLAKFSINLSQEQKIKIKEYWPGPTSIILDCPVDALAYLHRGGKTLAFRMPDVKELQEFLLETGPLIAPSANIEGLKPASNIDEAKNYFGNQVDLYVDGGTVKGKASKVIKLDTDGSVAVLRQ